MNNAIKNTIDFDTSMEFLRKDIELNLELQQEILDSDKMNSSFQQIENNLNLLYKKTRHLEDVLEYAKTFTSLKIDEYTNELSSIINGIEDITLIDKNLGYIEYEIDFIENAIAITDRNNTYKVEPCSVKNKLLMLSNRVNVEYEHTSLNRKCEQIPHSDNLKSFSCGEANNYRSVYVEEKLINGGITETITVYFKEPVEVNEIDIKAVNCKVENIRYVYINNIEEDIGEYITGVNKYSRVVSHVKFDLIVSNYDIVQYTVDASKITDNTWNNIILHDYPTVDCDITKLDYDMVISKSVYNSNTRKTTTTNYQANVKNEKKYTCYVYNFGLDTLKVKRIETNEDCYFVSKPIFIGKCNPNEYIKLFTNYQDNNNCGVEFYILDGDIEIPIIPSNDNYIYNERLFPETDLRFSIDESQKGVTQTKKNGFNINISIDDAKTQYEGRFSVDYKPKYNNYTYTPVNDTIRVKAIIRAFDNTITSNPYIKSISIKKFGGNSLWQTLF